MTADPVTDIADGLAILDALKAVGGRPFEWTEIDDCVIDRGAHAIFPLAVAPAEDAPDPTASGLLKERAQRLEQDCIHLYGGDWFHAEVRLDVETGFGRRLVESSMLASVPRYRWSVGRFSAVIARAVDQTRAFETLALHIIPKEWVWVSPIAPSTKRDVSHTRRILREQETIAGVADLAWSWPLPEGGPATSG
ncbi:hypothetical protein [Microbacterium sp. PMB16]|uniref:hypothetical protein n=1 Tax=Microbacterium sp. PMB16 TaxID=3120157 RepID=UPI003F4BC353